MKRSLNYLCLVIWRFRIIDPLSLNYSQGGGMDNRYVFVC